MLNPSWACRAVFAASALVLVGCTTTEQQRTIEPPKVAAATAAPYTGPRAPIAVGRFDNRSSFMRGIFSDGVDRVGSQSKTILVSHLQQTNRFSVLDRDNLEESKQERFQDVHEQTGSFST